MTSSKRRIVWLATGMMLLAPGLARAADATAETSVEELVVTAQKREQALFDVPMSITAVSGDELAKRGAQEIKDLQYSVPGLSISELAPGTQRIQLRGVSVFSGLPTVGVYLDELPLNGETSQTGLEVRLIDMERVEVLRGPQGTLYGQGAVGGTIRYITKAVDLNDFGGRIEGEAAQVRNGRPDGLVQAVVNAPIVAGTFGVRIAAARQEYGGWIDNTTLGAKDANRGSSQLLRAKALWRPSDALSVSFLISHQELAVSAQNLSGPNRAVTGLRTPARSDADIANLTITYDLGFATLLSSSGRIDRKDFYQYDLSNSFIPALEAPAPFGFGYPPGTFRSIAFQSHTGNEIFAQEVRLTSNGHGPLSWTVGGMYRDSETRVVGFTVNTPNIVPVDLLTMRGTSPSDSESWAGFGEVTWAFAPTFELTLGGRYFEDRRVQDAASVTFGSATADKGRKTFSTFSPRANLKWTPSDQWMVYGNIGKGFRSGGFNSVSAGFGVVPVPPTYAPDTLWSYEVGGQFRSADRRFRAEVALYYNDWQDVQSLAFATGFPVQYVVNGSNLGGFGIDAGAEWRATSALTLSVTGGYNDMKYTNTTGEHRTGDRADYVPRYSVSASADYAFQWTPDLPGFARVDLQVADGWQVFPRNILPAPAKAEVQHYLIGRLGAEIKGVTVAVFAKNILDEDKIVYPAFASLQTPMRQQPRTIGVSAAFDF